MKFKKLSREFFNRPTLTVAKELLGKFLVKDTFVGQIVEVEAYDGNIDPACHAFNGITPRTEVMFGKSGFSYIYLIYGMYFCLNIVTEKKGNGCAVLIRAVKPISGITKMIQGRGTNNVKNLCNGPGKLCQAFHINMGDNMIDMCKSESFYVEDRAFIPSHIYTSKRIGIKKGAEFNWRFYIKNES